MILTQLITTFSKKEQKEVIHFLQQKNRRSDVKNITLFKMLVQGKTKNLDTILYGKPSKNAFHALCKRLQDTLIEFVAIQGFEKESSEELSFLKLLLAARIFFEQKQYKLGFKVLATVESKASEFDTYAILTEIYHTKIQYAHHHPNLDLFETLKKANENLLLFNQEQRLNMAYASIKNNFKQQSTLTLERIFKDALGAYDIQLNGKLTLKSLSQLLTIVLEAANNQSDFYNILPLAKEIYTITEAKNDLTYKHRFYYISILYAVGVAHFRNKKFMEAQSILTKMEQQMSADNNKYYSLFEEKLITTQALCAQYTRQPEKAISLLSGAKSDTLPMSLAFMLCLFQQERFQETYNIIKKLQHTDAWYQKKQGWVWVIKKNMVEILTLIELNKLDLVLLRLSSFKNRFSKQLKVKGETRVLVFINLISEVYENPTIVSSSSFRDKIENSFQWKGTQKEDIFVMSFYAWLKSKMEAKKMYDVTIQLVST